MKLKWFFIFCLISIVIGEVFSQKGETSKKSFKPNIEGSVHSSEDNYIISDFIDLNPNPFIDVINIEILKEGEEYIQIEILSIVGKVVRKINFPSQNHVILNLSDLEKGIYLLKINNGKFSCIKRIIHQ
jgi:hypothetical protein